jgi:hypothetical protein
VNHLQQSQILLGYDDQTVLLIAKCWPHTLETLAIGGARISYDVINQLGEHGYIL